MIVIDDQHLVRLERGGFLHATAGMGRVGMPDHLQHGQRHRKATALVLALAARANRTAMQFDELFRRREPNAEPLALRLRLQAAKQREQQRLLVGGEADTAVLYANRGATVRRPARWRPAGI